MFMSTADRNRSGHAATDTINTFTARKGDGARVSFAGERMLHISFLYLRCVGADAWWWSWIIVSRGWHNWSSNMTLTSNVKLHYG